MNPIRTLLLRASESAALAEHIPNSAVGRRAVRRFMPGERLEDALDAAETLRARGMGTVVTNLGESVTTRAEADAVRDHYLGVTRAIADRGLPCDVSVKPTHLGLDLGFAAARERLLALLESTSARGLDLWLDMEYSRYVDATLELYRGLRERHEAVGIALQANLRRTQEDLDALLPLRPTVRLVKGAYREPAALAFTRARDVDDAYGQLAQRLLEGRVREITATRAGEPAAAGGVRRAVFGTHDDRLVDWTATRAEALGLARDAWEVHMLYGIRTDYARALVERGHTVRTLVSYGDAWFAWYVRRLAEKPSNVLLAARSLLPA